MIIHCIVSNIHYHVCDYFLRGSGSRGELKVARIETNELHIALKASINISLQAKVVSYIIGKSL